MSAAPPAARRPAEDPADPCAVPGCAEPAVRSLARIEVRKAFPALPEAGRRAPLCREHYKQYKKSTRKDRELARIDW
jgi:hypothetical protein